MGLYRRGQVWWMKFTCNEQTIRRSTETKNKKLAEKIFSKVITNVTEGKWFDLDQECDKTFPELVERYIREHSAVKKSPNTHRRDQSLSKNLLRFFGNRNLTEITPRLISDYKGERRTAGASASSINMELSFIRHAFNLAIKEWEWVQDNPACKVSREKINNRIERWLTLEEEKSLFEASPGWLQEIIAFAVNTGLRRGEITALRWSNVDIFRKTMTITEQKNGGTDTLPLNKTAMRVIVARYKARLSGTPYVFFSTTGTQIDGNNLGSDFRAAVKRSGIEHFRFHDLRHTFATRLAQNGIDLYTLQRLGRWKEVSMVMRYAHHNTESLRPGVVILDELGTISSQSNDQGATGNPVTP